MQNVISTLQKLGKGSITLNNVIDLDLVQIGPAKVNYEVKDNVIILTFDNDPEINIIGFKRNIFKIEISEDQIYFHVKRFPDLRIKIQS